MSSADTNQASELYELCKEVYEKTKWEGTYNVYESFTDSNGNEQCNIINTDSPYLALHQYQTPLYTSDYLLEKLPPSIQSKEYAGKPAFLWTRKEDDVLDKYPEGRITCFAWYFVTGIVDGVSDYGVHADTPLKALLRLTIALSEAGELK